MAVVQNNYAQSRNLKTHPVMVILQVWRCLFCETREFRLPTSESKKQSVG